MITDSGRQILAKYLIGQAQSYASYLAIGIGSNALSFGQTFPDFASQKSLEFEVLRAPIVSRGFVYDEQGNPNIVFAAELPTEERFEITEVGVYPAKTNPAAAGLESRLVFNFAESENWEYHKQNAVQAIPTILSPLNLDQPSGSIAVTDTAFRTNTNNTLFAGPIRIDLNERPRFLNRSMILRGDLSYLTTNPQNELEIFDDGVNFYSEHIHFNDVNLNFDSSAPDDELRLAFSVMSKDENANVSVESVKLMIEFADSDSTNPDNYARFEVNIAESDPGIDFNSNRYFVEKKKFSELVQTPGFAWKNVVSARIFATVTQIGQAAPSDNFYINLDGFRFENTTSKSPLYALTGYTVVVTDDGSPIVKETNAPNTVEFRFGMEVL